MSKACEFWTIVDEFGDPVLPVDESGHKDPGMLVYRSYEAATSAAEHQAYWFDVKPVPRRLDMLGMRIAETLEGTK